MGNGHHFHRLSIPLKRLYVVTIITFVLLFALTGCSPKSEPSTESTEATEATSDAAATVETTTAEAVEVTYPETLLTKEDIVYFIMVDRFADGDTSGNLADVDKDDLRAFQGGDLQGIIDNLDYIKATGATAIWLTPIMENGPNGYHGYWIYDFYKVDPHFGDLETFKELVDKAHEMDLKVVLDYIVNHTGYDSPWLDDPEKADWFNPDRKISNWKDKEEVELGWLSGLPDLDQTNPEVSEYFIENALWWIEETGIDGFRLDTMRHVSKTFWEDFSEAIKSEVPDFFLLGEVWDENAKTLESYHQSGIDSLTNYSLFNGIENAFTTQANMFSLVNALDKEKAFTHPELNAIFIDNHDNSRFASNNPRMALEYTKQALTFLYSYPAIPVVYYGTELGMSGAYDPENRRFMAWDTVENNDMLAYVKQLAEIRDVYMEDFVLTYHDKTSIAYELSNGSEKMLIVINSEEKDKSITFDYAAASLTDYETGEALASYDGNTFSETLSPVSVKFYIVN